MSGRISLSSEPDFDSEFQSVHIILHGMDRPQAVHHGMEVMVGIAAGSMAVGTCCVVCLYLGASGSRDQTRILLETMVGFSHLIQWMVEVHMAQISESLYVGCSTPVSLGFDGTNGRHLVQVS